MNAAPRSAATSVIIADDHPLFRAALRETVGRLLAGAEVVEAQDMASLERATEQHSEADLTLLDLHMPGAHGALAVLMLELKIVITPYHLLLFQSSSMS